MQPKTGKIKGNLQTINFQCDSICPSTGMVNLHTIPTHSRKPLLCSKMDQAIAPSSVGEQALINSLWCLPDDVCIKVHTGWLNLPYPSEIIACSNWYMGTVISPFTGEHKTTISLLWDGFGRATFWSSVYHICFAAPLVYVIIRYSTVLSFDYILTVMNTIMGDLFWIICTILKLVLLIYNLVY